MLALEQSSAPAQQGVAFGEALKFWLRLDIISFGGPARQIAIMHRALVEEKRWISEKRFLQAPNYCTLLPSTEAQQRAAYLRWLMLRTWGRVVADLLYGIEPAVAAIVVHAARRMTNKIWKNPARALVQPAVTAIFFIAIYFYAVPLLLAALTVGVVGWLSAGWA